MSQNVKGYYRIRKNSIIGLTHQKWSIGFNIIYYFLLSQAYAEDSESSFLPIKE